VKVMRCVNQEFEVAGVKHFEVSPM
jgi:hypothetical protein